MFLFILKHLKRKWRERKLWLPEKEAKELVKMVALEAFKCFRDKKFRQASRFNSQTQEEQDRFFNEIVVTANVFLRLSLHDNIYLMPPEVQPFWYKVEDALFAQYENWQKEIGIAGENFILWQKLTDMRMKEYAIAREDMVDLLRKHKIETSGSRQLDMVNRVSTLAIGLLFHIRRGENIDQDPLQAVLFKWVASLNRKILARIGW